MTGQQNISLNKSVQVNSVNASHIWTTKVTITTCLRCLDMSDVRVYVTQYRINAIARVMGSKGHTKVMVFGDHICRQRLRSGPADETLPLEYASHPRAKACCRRMPLMLWYPADTTIRYDSSFQVHINVHILYNAKSTLNVKR